MIIIATNKENCIKEFENELKRNPNQKAFTIYVDDGLTKSIIINNDYIVKRTYITNKNNAIETLIKAFEILPDESLYSGLTLKLKEKEEKEMQNNDFYELELKDITIKPEEMEKFSEDVTKTFKDKICEHYGLNPIIGVGYLNAITDAAAYGFNYAADLMFNKIFNQAKKPEEKKTNKLTKENKSKLLKMLEINPKKSTIKPTDDELKNEKITFTIDELADLLEDLFF